LQPGNSVQQAIYTTSGSFTNAAGGIVTVQSNWGNGNQFSIAGDLNNAGAIEVDGGNWSGSPAQMHVGGNFSNTGTLNLTPWSYYDGYVYGGQLLVAGNWTNLDASGNLTGGGTYDINGLLQYNGPANVTNIGSGIDLTVGSGGEIYNTATSTNALAGLAGNAGTFEIDNTNETFTPSGGTSTNSGTMTLGGTYGETVTILGTLANTGTVNLSGKNVTLNDDFNNSGGTLSFTGNTDIQNVTGNFNNVSGSTVSFTGSKGQINVTSGTFTNDGTSTVTMAGANDVITAGTFNNAGSVTIGASETITTGAGGYTQTAGTTQGFGTINGNVAIKGGNLIVGTQANPGIFTITGNAQLSGALTTYLEGTTAGAGGYSQLVIGGTASLGGTLDVDWGNGFTPTPGEDFYLLASAGGDSGQFSTLDIQALPTGEAWVLNYYPSSCPDGDSGCLELEVETSTSPTPPPVAVTPEPSTMVLVATGLFGLLA
jgi:hypothetical protein